jgi:hypothetical protein
MTTSDAHPTVGCHVIAVVNGKGGVGKTSTTANLAGILAAEGYRVCAVDSDPQGNLGLDLGVHHAGQSDDGAELMRAAMLGEAPSRWSRSGPVWTWSAVGTTWRTWRPRWCRGPGPGVTGTP